jgi:uncharacterized membrane protein YphA (DoxX/SURF4 family)
MLQMSLAIPAQFPLLLLLLLRLLLSYEFRFSGTMEVFVTLDFGIDGLIVPVDNDLVLIQFRSAKERPTCLTRRSA